MKDEAIATQDPLVKTNPSLQAEQVNTPAVVADPLEQLVLVVGIATHYPQGLRYFPVVQALQVKTPAEVAVPLAQPTLV